MDPGTRARSRDIFAGGAAMGTYRRAEAKPPAPRCKGNALLSACAGGAHAPGCAPQTCIWGIRPKFANYFPTGVRGSGHALASTPSISGLKGSMSLGSFRCPPGALEAQKGGHRTRTTPETSLCNWGYTPLANCAVMLTLMSPVCRMDPGPRAPAEISKMSPVCRMDPGPRARSGDIEDVSCVPSMSPAPGTRARSRDIEK